VGTQSNKFDCDLEFKKLQNKQIVKYNKMGKSTVKKIKLNLKKSNAGSQVNLSLIQLFNIHVFLRLEREDNKSQRISQAI
jgi:hypothetical protein